MILLKSSLKDGSILAVITLICICVFTSSSQAASNVASTRVVTFYPAGASQTASGYCWTGSLAALRADAWRCFIGNAINDPCFSSSPQANYVICTQNPLEPRSGVRINLTKPLPPVKAPVGQATRPWTIMLANGTMCSYLTGATGIVDGERLNYGCVDQSYLIGEPQKGALWTAQRYVQGQPKTTTVQLSEVWF